MKKIVLLITTICLTSETFGQKTSSSSVDEYECIYEYQMKNDKGSSDATSTILQIGRNSAMFSDYTAFQADSAIACKAPESEIQKFKTREKRNDLLFDQSVSQNVPKGKLTVYSVITPNYYSYTESANPINWNLSEGIDTICGYTCQKAVGEYGGRTWTVWYSTDIPASFGPWKLCGLPGLVLAAKDSEGIHKFKAITFRKSSTPMNFKPYTNTIKTSREQFVKAKNKFEQNPMGNIPAESISEMTIQKYEDGGHSALVNGVVLRVRPNGYVPLELKQTKRLINMIRFLILMMLACLCNCTFAQSVVTGIVRDTIGTALEGVIVRVNADKATLGFARTSENGTYKITLKSDAKQLIVTAEAIGYEKTKREIKNVSQECNFNLKEKTTDLKEVVVKAPAIYQRGDTLSYNLASYIGKNDYTLKDAMKKLPGIEVGDKGSIKYLGKEISNFYINGMDLLGGRYNIATTNIPASFVNSVQVLSNHQAVKANKDVFSDNVAINVNMSNKAKFKPVGSYGVSLGAGKHTLYEINGAGMLFKSNFQMLASLKAGNINQFALTDGTNHFDNKETLSTLSNLLENISATTPPIEVDRYASPTDRLLSFNILRKIRKDVTLKGNIGYSYAKSQYDYSLTRSYADADNNVIIAQEYSPLSTIHRPSIQLEYKDNSEKTYLSNTLSSTGSFLTSELPTKENGSLFNQKQTMREFYVNNKFSTLWHHKDLCWAVTSIMSYQGSPMGKITLNKETTDNVVQNANGRSFRTENTLSMSKKHLYSRIYLPILLNYYMDKVQTSLHPTDESNDVNMQNLRMALVPQYEYSHPQYKYVFRLEIPMRIDYIIHKDNLESASSGSWYYSVCPSVYCNYKVTSRSVLRTNIFYARTFGDILDFLKTPVRFNDTSLKVGSGILADNKSLNASLHYDYKIPLKMWFFNADFLYNQEKNNLLMSQDASSTLITMSKIYAPNTGRSFMGQVGVTKFIEPIKTKISLNGGYQWKRQTTLQNDNQQKYTWKSWTFSPYLTSQPCKYVELAYNGMFAKTYLSTKYQNNSYLSQQHKVSLKLMPFDGFTFDTSADIVSKRLRVYTLHNSKKSSNS